MKDMQQVEMVTVTPALAAEWLKRNANNRPLRRLRVETYARDLEQGFWRFTGDSIKFDVDCNLIDGQHRLAACVKSGVAFQVLVVRGLPAETFDVLDRNLARRASDVMNQHGLQYATRVAAAARLVIGYERGVLHNTNAMAPFVTTSCLLEEARTDEDVYTAATKVAMRAEQVGFFGSGFCSFMVLVIRRAGLERASEFAEACISGVGLEEGDARAALVNMMRGPHRPKTSVDALALLIRTWNAWGRNESRKRIKPWIRGTPFPVIDAT